MLTFAIAYRSIDGLNDIDDLTVMPSCYRVCARAARPAGGERGDHDDGPCLAVPPTGTPQVAEQDRVGLPQREQTAGREFGGVRRRRREEEGADV